jgi:hypothetical protein
VSKITDILELDYETFVKELKELIKEPKIASVLSTYKKESEFKKFKFSKGNAVSSSLIPLQQELVFEYSLKWALIGKDLMRLSEIIGGGPVLIHRPIVTLNETYIIDGHHAWIEAAAFNPHSKVVVYNITVDEQPIRVLKIAQLAIASITNEIPSSSSKGSNILKMTAKQFTKIVSKYVIKKVLDVVDKTTDELSQLLYDNIQTLNKPIKRAPHRDIMPQLSRAPGYDKALAEHRTYKMFLSELDI